MEKKNLENMKAFIELTPESDHSKNLLSPDFII